MSRTPQHAPSTRASSLAVPSPVTRRAFVAGTMAYTALPVRAQGFPTRPVTLVMPFAAGGYADVVARILAEKVGADLGQTVIVENRTGGNGVIGIQAGIRARPDGYTLVQAGTATITLPMMTQAETYDWEHGLTPVIGLGSVPLVFVVKAGSSVRSIADLVALARATPGGLNYGSGGPGAAQLAPARLLNDLKIPATHVAYRGLSAAVQALLSDQVHLVCPTTVDVLQLVAAGQVRPLAVTSERRIADLPDTPTMGELGFKDYVMETWTAYMAPAGTPRPAIEHLFQAFARAASDPGVQERVGKLGFIVKIRNPEQTARFMREETVLWRRVITENRIRYE